MALLAIVPKYAKLGEGFSRREQREAAYHPGRRTDGTQSAATWMVNLSDLRKLITLCGFCAPRFNPKRNGYRRFYCPDHTGKTSGYQVSGICDACKTRLVANGMSFIAEETYKAICQDPIQARRKARMKARAAATIWSEINRLQGSRRPRDAAARI